MNTIYTYEAYSKIPDISMYVDGGYVPAYWAFSIIWASIAFALAIFTAIMIKKARPLGILVALLQPVAFIASAIAVSSYSSINFSCLNTKTTSSISMDDAMSKLYTRLAELFATEIFPDLIPFIIATIALAFIALITLIYYITLIKAHGRIFAIFAMLLTIIRLLMPPVEFFSLFVGFHSTGIQNVWDFLFRAAIIIPLVLVSIQAIVYKIRSKADKVKGVVDLVASKTADDVPEVIVVDEAAEVVTPAEENNDDK